MLHKSILACVALLLLVTPSEARPKLSIFSGKCLCVCLVSGTAVDAVYEAKSSSGCVLLEHKTCNVSLDGLVRTGTLETCESLMTNVKVQGRTNTPTRARP
jgi:hypothetical protein